jgi:hypothetical protein
MAGLGLTLDCARVDEIVSPSSQCVDDYALQQFVLLGDVPQNEAAATAGVAGELAAAGELGAAAAAACPAACNQCELTRRGCLQFSPSFLAVLGILQNCSTVIAATIFGKLLAVVPLRRVLFYIQLVLPVAALCDLVLAMRWNVAVGLDDHLFGGLDTIVVFTANSLKTIAVYTLVTAVCPPQVEATLFSWIMGFMYLGTIVSQTMGMALARAVGISGADYSSLWCGKPSSFLEALS